MENQYCITVANKYALFLNEDEDPLEILKLQEATKTTKKSEKPKKNVTNENEVKTTSNKQSAATPGSSQKKPEKIDHFSSPNQSEGILSHFFATWQYVNDLPELVLVKD